MKSINPISANAVTVLAQARRDSQPRYPGRGRRARVARTSRVTPQQDGS